MPRRTYKRKPYGNRRRRTFKRNFRRKRYTKRGVKVFPYTRYTGRLGPINISNNVDTLAALDFSLEDLPNYTEFTNLYDMYKINAVKLTFLPQMTQNVSLSSFNNPSANARFFSAIDYNDGAAPTSIDQLREYKTCKYTPILKPHKRMIYKPKLLDRGGAYSVTPWVTTDDPFQNYFGLKIAIEPMDSTSIGFMSYNIEAKYYLTFKNVK